MKNLYLITRKYDDDCYHPYEIFLNERKRDERLRDLEEQVNNGDIGGSFDTDDWMTEDDE